MPAILVLAAVPVIRAQELLELPTLGDVQLTDVTLATSSGRITPQDLQRSAYEVAVTTGPSGHHSVELLGALAAALVPGGKLIVCENGLLDASTLQKNLLLSGFTGAQALPDVAGCFSAIKPTWETGAKAAISLKPKPKTWTLAADDDDEELVDEDDLLTEEDLKRPVPAAGGDDCEVGGGGKKACDNCTCGRADGKVQKLTKDMLENPTSGCGSCSLGDAFRCGGCPYRGLPAFEMGKKIELPPGFLLADLE